MRPGLLLLSAAQDEAEAEARPISRAARWVKHEQAKHEATFPATTPLHHARHQLTLAMAPVTKRRRTEAESSGPTRASADESSHSPSPTPVASTSTAPSSSSAHKRTRTQTGSSHHSSSLSSATLQPPSLGQSRSSSTSRRRLSPGPKPRSTSSAHAAGAGTSQGLSASNSGSGSGVRGRRKVGSSDSAGSLGDSEQRSSAAGPVAGPVVQAGDSLVLEGYRDVRVVSVHYDDVVACRAVSILRGDQRVLLKMSLSARPSAAQTFKRESALLQRIAEAGINSARLLARESSRYGVSLPFLPSSLVGLGWRATS